VSAAKQSEARICIQAASCGLGTTELLPLLPHGFEVDICCGWMKKGREFAAFNNKSWRFRD
jgi:hypothetical protein